jgi:hypothetical protein
MGEVLATLESVLAASHGLDKAGFFLARRGLSPNYREGAPAVWTETIDREVVVQGGRTLDAEPPHYREAGSVHNREVLVAIGFSDFPSRIRVRRPGGLYGGGAGSQAFPKSFGGAAARQFR